MKKFIVTTCGTIIIGLLMISSATAVPKVNSDPLMDKINEIEKTKKIIEENINNKILDLKTRGSINLLIKTIKDTIYDITLDFKSRSFIINLLIKIIQWLISVVQDLINLVELLITLVNLIGTLFGLIKELINLIIDIFTPGTLKST
jgi:hypothetical protein